MRVIISAGGTGGHIYPALAILKKIKEMEPDSEFLYVGTHNRMEKDIVPLEGIPFKSIEIYGYSRKHMLKNVKTLYFMLKNKHICKKIIKDFNPDIVIGVGGYVTVPVITAAHKLGYKTMIHEQNSVPGKANIFLSKKVDLICVSLKNSLSYFDPKKTIFTGNPVAEKTMDTVPINKKDFNLREDKKLVLFVMGSQGAGTVNDVITKSFILFKDKDYDVLFVTGKSYYEDIPKDKIPSNVHVVPYINGLGGVLKKTDLMVTRAGASTISELIALKVPSILIPSPYVPDDHQTKNAMDLVNNNGAVILPEKDLTPDRLIVEIENLLNDNKKLEDMKSNLAKLYIKDSGKKIYDEIKKIER